MRKFFLAILLIITIFCVIGITVKNKRSLNINITNYKQLTQKEKLDDFEYMYTILKENYPYFEVNKRLNHGLDWLSKKGEYISAIKSTNDDDSFFNVLQKTLSDLCNGHTYILDEYSYSSIKSVYERSKEINGAWLNQLNNVKAIKRYSTTQDIVIKSQSLLSNITPNNVKTNILVKGKIAYLSIHSFSTFNIDGDMKIIKPYFQDIKDYKALIIDIRGNGGGDSRYWSDNMIPMLMNKPLVYTQYTAYRGGLFIEQFIKSRSGSGYESLEPISSINEANLKNLPPELKKDFKYYSKNTIMYNPQNSIGFIGKIYLLVDGGVYSSSEAFATFAKLQGLLL